MTFSVLNWFVDLTIRQWGTNRFCILFVRLTIEWWETSSNVSVATNSASFLCREKKIFSRTNFGSNPFNFRELGSAPIGSRTRKFPKLWISIFWHWKKIFLSKKVNFWVLFEIFMLCRSQLRLWSLMFIRLGRWALISGPLIDGTRISWKVNYKVIENRGLIELAQSGGTHRHLP